MNLRLTNQLNMVGACLTVANSPEYQAVWTGQEPSDFAADLALLQAGHGAVIAKAAQAEGATGGAADAKAGAETTLEEATFVLARALAVHFKKLGDLDRYGKVDVSKSDIVKLRTQDLLNKATAIRDLGNAEVAHADAAKRGVTATRVAAVTTAITEFSRLMNAPRGQIVNRSALLRDVETDMAALVARVADLDDLVWQFDSTEAGQRFIEAWKRARIIVDLGGNGNATPTPLPPPAPAAVPA